MPMTETARRQIERDLAALLEPTANTEHYLTERQVEAAGFRGPFARAVALSSRRIANADDLAAAITDLADAFVVEADRQEAAALDGSIVASISRN